MLIAQLSDPHVRPGGVLYQDVACSNTQFTAAIAELHALDPRPDLVLLSGDLVDKGAPPEYAKLCELLRGLEIPSLVIPGNHDDREAFRSAFRDHDYLPAAGPMHYAVGTRTGRCASWLSMSRCLACITARSMRRARAGSTRRWRRSRRGRPLS
jgi:Icc protein